MGWTDVPDPDYPVKSEIIEEQENKEYYINKETAEVAQSLFDNADMRLLFDAAKDSKPEDLKMAADLLKRLKATNPEG